MRHRQRRPTGRRRAAALATSRRLRRRQQQGAISTHIMVGPTAHATTRSWPRDRVSAEQRGLQLCASTAVALLRRAPRHQGPMQQLFAAPGRMCAHVQLLCTMCAARALLPPPLRPDLRAAAWSPHPYPLAGLPVWQAKADFINMVNSSQTIILVGETGSGKTTQIAQVWRRPRPAAMPAEVHCSVPTVQAHARAGLQHWEQKCTALPRVQSQAREADAITAPDSLPRPHACPTPHRSCPPPLTPTPHTPTPLLPSSSPRRATARAARRWCARSRGEWRPCRWRGAWQRRWTYRWEKRWGQPAWGCLCCSAPLAQPPSWLAKPAGKRARAGTAGLCRPGAPQPAGVTGRAPGSAPQQAGCSTRCPRPPAGRLLDPFRGVLRPQDHHQVSTAGHSTARHGTAHQLGT